MLRPATLVAGDFGAVTSGDDLIERDSDVDASPNETRLDRVVVRVRPALCSRGSSVRPLAYFVGTGSRTCRDSDAQRNDTTATGQSYEDPLQSQSWSLSGDGIEGVMNIGNGGFASLNVDGRADQSSQAIDLGDRPPTRLTT